MARRREMSKYSKSESGKSPENWNDKKVSKGEYPAQFPGGLAKKDMVQKEDFKGNYPSRYE